jgi:hypothetical protein
VLCGALFVAVLLNAIFELDARGYLHITSAAGVGE